MPIAYSYKRFSSIKQEEGDSLRRQTELAAKYVAKHNLELDTSLTLHDLGVSAFKGDNVKKGALGLFVKAIDDGIVKPGSYLLVEHLDRLSRQQVTVAMELFLNITRKGITIVTLADEQVYSHESISDNWTKLIIAVSIMAGAHESSKTKAKRIGDAWQEKRANLATKRFTKMCPDWLRPTETGWEIIEEKAFGVRRVYELNAEGYGKNSIAKILNEDKTPALSDKGWHANTVQKLLLSRTVLGEFQSYTGRHPNRVPVGDPVPDYYPRIIDETLWLSVKRKDRSTAGKGYKEMVNVFRGLLRCSECGGTVTTYSSTTDGISKRTIGCYEHQRGLCKVKAKWKYPDFLETFLQFVSEVDLATLLRRNDDGKALRDQANVIQFDIDKLDIKITNLGTAFADDPSPTLNKMLRDFERERAALQAQLKDIEDQMLAGMVPVEVVQQDLDEAIANLDKEEFRMRLNVLLRNMINKITVNLGGTGLQLDGMKAPDTEKRFTVHFRNGMVRTVNPDANATRKFHSDKLVNLKKEK